MRFRIGINIGDAIADGTDLHGDAVNVAVRLQAECPPGGICVTRAVRDHVRLQLDLAFEELGSLRLKNIDRPVEAFVLNPANAAMAIPPAGSEPPPPSGKPSIAVLSFQNMSGDPEQEYFADGMVEEIITALSRNRGLFVIARNSTSTYKGKAVDVGLVGRQLGVRYVLEGSVRRWDDRVRITYRLLQAERAYEVWTNSFDGVLDRVFELQDQVAAAVARAIEPKLRQAEIEQAQRKPTNSLEAYDLYLRALPHHYSYTLPGNRQAEHLLRQALQQDPEFAAAKALLADVQMRRYSDGLANPRDRLEGVLLARSVLRSDTEDPIALSYASLALLVLDHAHSQARVALERSIAVNPNSAHVLNHAGWVWTFCCEGGRAVEFFEQAIRLSPRDLAMPNFLAGVDVCSSD
jgi:adenylate cyclase